MIDVVDAGAADRPEAFCPVPSIINCPGFSIIGCGTLSGIGCVGIAGGQQRRHLIAVQGHPPLLPPGRHNDEVGIRGAMPVSAQGLAPSPLIDSLIERVRMPRPGIAPNR